MKTLITGGNGFVGKHLVTELEKNGYDVLATDINELDITDYPKLRNFLFRFRPDYIFHLAGISYVPSSWQDPELVFNVNTIGSLNLFNAVRSVGIDPIIQIACSSEEYGLVEEDEIPIKETNPLRPLSPYAVSKIAMDLLGYQYFKSYGMKIIRTRAFNHEGYGRPETFMPSSFAKQFVEGKVVKHGNLEAVRDITDVRDMVCAYRLAVEKCEPGEAYNIGSGNGYSGKDILKKLEEITGFKPEYKQDVSRMRPSDLPVLISDPTKFMKKTGWKPKYSIKDTLEEEIRYWKRVGR